MAAVYRASTTPGSLGNALPDPSSSSLLYSVVGEIISFVYSLVNMQKPLYAFLITILILLLTGNLLGKKLVEYMSFSWLERFAKKKE